MLPDRPGLLPARERGILLGEGDVSRNYLFQIRSPVRDKIDALTTDIENPVGAPTGSVRGAPRGPRYLGPSRARRTGAVHPEHQP